MFGGNFIEIVIGGAPFNPEVEAFLRKINFPYTIAYGMTECAPLICHSFWDEIKYTSCGKTVEGMEPGYSRKTRNGFRENWSAAAET